MTKEDVGFGFDLKKWVDFEKLHIYPKIYFKLFILRTVSKKRLYFFFDI